jgi:hypothetical protein
MWGPRNADMSPSARALALWFALAVGCGPDWDRVDPSLGDQDEACGGECPDGRVCDGESCVECVDAADCASPNRACIASECVACADADDCDGGDACSPATFECVSACADDGDCPDERPLCDDESDACVECLRDDHCRNNEDCVDFTCR